MNQIIKTRAADTESIDRDRRRFLGTAAMAIAGAHLGVSRNVEANQRAPRELAAIGGAAEWLNSRLPPPSLAGKVVLVDFWTYTCINWLRTLPYIRAWAEKYREALVVIGVHTPEFAFERDLENVRRAVRQMRIEYPVAIDNDYAIWRAFRNQYWPALYFIDARGRVRQHHFGEGEYQRSESAIQRLLAETGVGGLREGDAVSVDARGIEAAADWDNLKSPETYVGYDRAQNFASRGGAKLDRRRVYAVPARLALNQWALAGEWTMGRQGHRPRQSQRADRAPLSRARPSSRHGSASGRIPGTFSRVDRRAAAGSCSRLGR
jgi:thiol-disulfide isomerase/thioredoxin